MYILATPGLPEIVTQLFPNLPNFIAHVLATIVLIIVLSKLVYKPFRKMIEERRNKINELLDNAAENQAKANKSFKDAQLKLKEAKDESLSIIRQARVEADASKMEILEKAKQEAATMNANAKNSVLRERQEAEAQIRQSIIETAMAAASKILNKEVDSKTDAKIVDEFIDNLDK